MSPTVICRPFEIAIPNGLIPGTRATDWQDTLKPANDGVLGSGQVTTAVLPFGPQRTDTSMVWYSSHPGMPSAVKLTSDGATLFVGDQHNYLYRTVAVATGVVGTLAGTGSTGDADGAPAGKLLSGGTVPTCSWPAVTR